VDYQMIVSKLYKFGLDNILQHCVLENELPDILWECHSGVLRGHVSRMATARKILHEGLWWPTLIFKDSKEYS
jgi:hypothetical protein